MTRKPIYYMIFMMAIYLSLNGALFSVTQAEAKKMTIKAISAWGKNHDGVKGEYLPYIKRANEVFQWLIQQL